MSDPQTLDEWQAAVDAADFLLLIDTAQQYGLITGGPQANVDRCLAILEYAASRGIFPSPPDRRRAWVAQWLARERLDLGVTQVEIARRAGLHPVAISLIIRGRRDINAAMWERLHAAILAIREEQSA